MKAALNGVPQLSTLDGWWAEGYDGLNGWAIPSSPLPAGQDGDAADAEQLYRLLETGVVPLFYDRDARGVPRGWVEKMKHAIRTAGARFTAQRMVREYLTEYYLPAMRGEPSAGDPPTARQETTMGATTPAPKTHPRPPPRRPPAPNAAPTPA